jgi:hypothetical protein
VKVLTPTGAFRAWTTVGLLLVTMGIMMGITITYVAQRQRDICGLIVLIDDRNQKMPPATDKDTQDFRTELHRYRQRLGC